MRDRPGREVDRAHAVGVRVDDEEARPVGADGDGARVHLLARRAGRARRCTRSTRPATRPKDAVDGLVIAACTGVRVNVTELASAEGSPTAETSGTQSCSRSVVGTRGPASPALRVRERARLPGQDALRHLQPAEAERLPVGSRADVRALVRPLDDLVLIPVVPAVEHELVESPDAVFDEGRERGVAREQRDELVGVAQRALEDPEPAWRERHGGRRVARRRPVDARARDRRRRSRAAGRRRQHGRGTAYPPSRGTRREGRGSPPRARRGWSRRPWRAPVATFQPA